MDNFPEYTFSNGITIKPRMEPDGAFRAMGDWEITESKVFDVFHRDKLCATAETWEQAKDMALSLFAQQHPRRNHTCPDCQQTGRYVRTRYFKSVNAEVWECINQACKSHELIWHEPRRQTPRGGPQARAVEAWANRLKT